MAKLNYSRQREAILQNLRCRTDHPTAEEVYLSVKPEFPNISLGTVYRNLNLLAESGEIIHFRTGDRDRFDGNANEHYHFICEKCGKIEDVFLSSENFFYKKFRRLIPDATINFVNVIIEGVCGECGGQAASEAAEDNN